MTEVIAAIVGAVVGVILSLFAAPLEWLAWVVHRRYGPRPKVYDLFDVNFVNEQGQNIYSKNDESKLQGDDHSWFIVNVHFKLRVKESVVITNIELAYPDLVAWPGEQAITIDEKKQTTDSRFGLSQHQPMDKEAVIDVQLWRKFFCEAEQTWYGDYKHVVATIEFTTRRSEGFHRLVITGLLATGGQVSDVVSQLAESAPQL